MKQLPCATVGTNSLSPQSPLNKVSMQFKFVILISLFFATLLVSCRKQNSIEVNNLYGKWKLIEIYDEWGSSTHGWFDVSSKNLQQIEFSANGRYAKFDSSGGTLQQCSGTYRMQARNKIEIHTTCDPANESLTISELTNESLIIDQLGTEGIIRYKYKANR